MKHAKIVPIQKMQKRLCFNRMTVQVEQHEQAP